MARAVESPITLFEIVMSVWTYRKRVVVTSLFMLVVSVVVVFLLPKKYESEAQLFVRLGRGSASLDPATVGQTISIQESREAEMNSIVNMLESRGLAERVVDAVGAERLLKKYAFIEVAMEAATDMVPSLGGGAVSDGESEPLTKEQVDAGKRRDLAIKEFMSNLKVDLPKKSTTISVVYRGRTPNLAQDTVAQVVEVYQRMHLEAYQSDGALSFFEAQFAEQKKLVAESEDALRVAKNEAGIVTLKDRQNSLRDEFTETKKLQLAAQAEFEATQSRVKSLESDLVALPEEVNRETTKGIAENARDAMRDRLYDLEIREKELAAKYSESHPELEKVRAQLVSAQKILDNQPDEREQSVVAVNPVRIEIENALIKARGELQASSAKVQALETLEQKLVQRQRELNDLEIRSEELQRKIDISRDNYRTYARKLEEARINSALDQDSLSNVSVVSAPTIRFKHSSPKRSLLLVLAVVFSGICGVGVAILSDYYARETQLKSEFQDDYEIYRSNAEQPRLSRGSDSRIPVASSSHGDSAGLERIAESRIPK